MRTRDEHVEWSKQDALRVLDSGNAQEAVTVMMSDLRHHPETMNHPGIEIGMMFLLTSQFKDDREVRRWIEGFH